MKRCSLTKNVDLSPDQDMTLHSHFLTDGKLLVLINCSQLQLVLLEYARRFSIETLFGCFALNLVVFV
ncbi:hypothetical protein [Chlorogloeopsis sp. ULAP02]|uniref:hypothetical protein n=1 Tax=Chlorogloeopsis sp. ULAP02 TaxID=3107926 RepID=UPI003136A4FE